MTDPGCLLGCLLTWGSGCGRKALLAVLTLAPSGERRICGTVESSKLAKRKGASETVLWNNAPLILFQSESLESSISLSGRTQSVTNGSSLIHGVQAKRL